MSYSNPDRNINEPNIKLDFKSWYHTTRIHKILGEHGLNPFIVDLELVHKLDTGNIDFGYSVKQRDIFLTHILKVNDTTS